MRQARPGSDDRDVYPPRAQLPNSARRRTLAQCDVKPSMVAARRASAARTKAAVAVETSERDASGEAVTQLHQIAVERVDGAEHAPPRSMTAAPAAVMRTPPSARANSG